MVREGQDAHVLRPLTLAALTLNIFALLKSASIQSAPSIVAPSRMTCRVRKREQLTTNTTHTPSRWQTPITPERYA